MRGSRPERSLEELVVGAVAPRPGEVLLAAVSGGPDSVALAALLARCVTQSAVGTRTRSHASAVTPAGSREPFGEQRNRLPAGGADRNLRQVQRDSPATLILAHVNHGARPSAWQDEAVALALGATLDLRVVCLALQPNGNQPAAEAAMRDARYALLADLARQVRAQRVFTAHHAEDQTETVLLALFRGTGPEGLAGMAPTRPLADGIELVRPLLGVSRDALAAYCAARHWPYALDPSNANLQYRRNAVRAALSDLRPEFPHLDEAVARCALILREEVEGSARAGVRKRLRAALKDLDLTRDVPFERLDAAARAIERARPGSHHLGPGIDIELRRRRPVR